MAFVCKTRILSRCCDAQLDYSGNILYSESINLSLVTGTGLPDVQIDRVNVLYLQNTATEVRFPGKILQISSWMLFLKHHLIYF